MVKTELMKKIANKIEGVSQKNVSDVISAFEDVILETLKEDRNEKITLGGLGSFKVKHVPDRVGKIMLGKRKGDEYRVPAHDEITFKMAKSTKAI